jgi:sialic acid synthase SpsE
MAIFIIAEAGVNHNGSLGTAKRLVDSAKRAGADAVKFQFFDSKVLWGDDRIKHLELRFADFERIEQHCSEVGIEFMCTPFGVAELLLLQPMLKRVKIASGCITRRPLLEAAGATGLPIIMSTGMSDEQEVIAARVVLRGAGCKHLTLLHCTSSYPCAVQDVNLRAMNDLPYSEARGYSDHTLGITIPIAAAAMGATVIEKHLTLDRTAEGPDHKASIEPNDFLVMVSAIRTVEEALGDGIKRVQPSEQKLREMWRVPAKADRTA